MCIAAVSIPTHCKEIPFGYVEPSKSDHYSICTTRDSTVPTLLHGII